jgi:signal transduction histidine kinase
MAIAWEPASRVTPAAVETHNGGSANAGLLRMIEHGLGREYKVTDGSTLAATLQPPRPPPAGPFPAGGPPLGPPPPGGPLPDRLRPLVGVLFTLILTALMLIALLLWAARAITAPLARFADAAEGFALDRDPSPLPEEVGPYEVRTASKALNQLQSRVRSLVDNRTRMLAAMSHDLRTPITRMRLRAEFIEQNETRELMLRDLDQMDRMVRAALAYLRRGPSTANRELVDIASLLQTICNDFLDLGNDIHYRGPNRLLVRCNIDELQRAVTNLIENSLKYAKTRVVVELRTVTDELIFLEVIDHGPGIPNSVKESMLVPFVRGESGLSSGDRAGGFGLGLAIAKAVAEAHGGKLCLLDSVPTGLVAQLQLPIRVKQTETPAPQGL